MRHSILFLLFLTCSSAIFSQSFTGYRSGNYTGVNGAFFNPASIADSRYRFDFNLVSLSTSIGNDNASFTIRDISNSFNSEELKNQFIGEKSKKSNGLIVADILGPSLMFNTGKKSALAITTRARALGNIIDMDGKLISAISNDLEDVDLPYSIESEKDMRLAVNGWSEFGLSYAREVKNTGRHYIKAGVSIKYLAGASNGYVNVNQLNGTINEDAVNQEYYLSNASGRIGIGLGGASLSDFDVEALKEFKSSGFGADLGFVYEYRPDHAKFESVENFKSHNKYKFQVSVAVLDLGKIKIKQNTNETGLYDIHVTGNQRLYLSELDNIDLDNYKDFFDSKPEFFTPVQNKSADQSYSLPTTIQLGIDYHLHRGFYVNLVTQLPLNKDGDTHLLRNRLYTAVTITPRYEGKRFGLYIPLQYNALTGINAGASVRLGPVFLGTGSGLTALLGDTKQADVFLGFKFSFLR